MAFVPSLKMKGPELKAMLYQLLATEGHDGILL